MGNPGIIGIITTPLKIIKLPKGNILHGMKVTDKGYAGFGEAYFSTVIKDEIKAWKKHKVMTLNLIVPVGSVKFVVYDQRQASPTFGIFNEYTISKENYYRLTVPPEVWFGFKGLGDTLNMILNIASIPHDPSEVERLDLLDINYNWL